MAVPIKHYGKWRIRWLAVDGRRCSEVHATRKEADFALRRHEVEVEELRRGLRSAPVVDHTFDELIEYWLEFRASRKRSIKDDESIIRRHLRPSFGSFKLREIGTAQVDRFVSERTALNKKTVHNHLTLLRSMLNVAVDLGWLSVAPRFKKPSVRAFSRDFRYLRSQAEIRRFLDAARLEGEMTYALYATAVFSGMRAGELAGLHWADVDFGTRLITVQRSFNGPTKADDVRYVPLLDCLLPVLRQWRLSHPGQLVFANRDGGMLRESGRIFQEVLHRVLQHAGMPSVKTDGRVRHHIRFHDLRHTFASAWMMSGGDLFKLQRILGHKDTAMTQRYAHLAPTAFVADLGRLGDASLLAGGEVRAIAGARAS